MIRKLLEPLEWYKMEPLKLDKIFNFMCFWKTEKFEVKISWYFQKIDLWDKIHWNKVLNTYFDHHLKYARSSTSLPGGNLGWRFTAGVQWKRTWARFSLGFGHVFGWFWLQNVYNGKIIWYHTQSENNFLTSITSLRS